MKFYVLLLAFFALSCSSSPTVPSDVNESPAAEVSSTDSEMDFPTFLAAFAESLEKVDNQSLNKLVAEKLVVWGREDLDPKLELDYIDRIIQVMEVYERGGIVDETGNSISYKELFANEKLLKKTIQSSGDEQRIEDFVFSKDKSGQWKLTLVYWNTKKK